MRKPWYDFKALAEGSDTAEVSILDEIHPWYGVNAISFLNSFRALKADKVKLYINSPGGSVTEGIAMFNGMRATGKQIEVHVLGIAASMGSYLAMVGDKVVMPRNTMMLLHKPMSGVHGNADDMRDAAEMLDSVESLLLGAYLKRFKGTEEELKALLAEDKILTAEQCLEHGFADELTDEIEATASFDLDLLPPEAHAAFKRAQPAQAKTLLPVAEVERAVKAAGLADFVAVFATDPKLETAEHLAAAVANASEIVALGRIVGLADNAAQLVRERKPLAEARVALAAALEAAAGDHVDTAVRAKSLESPADKTFNPIAIWNAIEAAKAGSKKQ